MHEITNTDKPQIAYSECYAQVFLGDCLIESDKIESGSVDLILTDLPYGNMQGVDFDNMTHGKKENKNQKIYWDELLPLDKVFEICNRILRKNGKAIFTAQGSFTFELYKKQLPNLPFNHKMIWDKEQFANCLLVNKAPLNYYEDILIFSKTHDLEKSHPLIDYLKSELEKTGMSQNDINNLLGNKMGGHYFTNGFQFCVPTKTNYFKLQTTGYFQTPYEELKAIDDKFKNKFASTFNLWEGNKYKSNILKYKKDYNGYHPTQKPILLLEDLIKTFSNENDLVVDLTMGSGSTGVACKKTNRNFIGIEKDENYFKIAEQRINAQTLFF